MSVYAYNDETNSKILTNRYFSFSNTTLITSITIIFRFNFTQTYTRIL